MSAPATRAARFAFALGVPVASVLDTYRRQSTELASMADKADAAAAIGRTYRGYRDGSILRAASVRFADIASRSA